jgi:tetratricopeptide (TPR) repeat protein
MRYIPLSLALIYLTMTTVTTSVWAKPVEPSSKTKPIPIACYLQAAGIQNDNPLKMNNVLNRELASGNFDRVFQLIPALKFNTTSELNVHSAIIRQAITNNRDDIIDATLPQIVRLNSQLDREDKTYLRPSSSWHISLSLARDLIKSGRTKSGITLLKYVETITSQESAMNMLGSQSTAFPAPDNEIIYIHPILIEIADNYSKADRITDAIRLLQKFQRSSVKSKKTGTIALDSYLLAQSYLQAKQPQIALKLIATSRQQATNVPDVDRQIALLVAISKFYRSLGKPKLSLRVLQQSIQIATKSQDANLAGLSLALLSSTAI